MAMIDLCSASESCGLGNGMMSPRISFSHDLLCRDSDVVPVEQYCHRSDASLLDDSGGFDFDFGINSASFEQQPPLFSAADELFSDGKILPCGEIIREQKTVPLPPLPPLLPSSPNDVVTETTTTTTTMITISTDDDSKKERCLKEIMMSSSESKEEEEEEDKAAPPPPPSSKSFWGFRRSTSLNSGNGQQHRLSLLCSLPLLSRSYSTGSSSSTNSNKRQPLLKDSQKHSHKPPHPTTMPAKSSSSSSSSSFYSWSSQSQKPPLKKNNSGSYGNGVRISPVLNVPSPYICNGTANLFGLASLFCSGKDKTKKK